MSKLDQPSATSVLLAFHGPDVHQTLKDNYDVVAAIWKLCSGLLDAEIKVYTSPRLTDADTLEWNVHIASPTGRRTILVQQRRPAGNVIFNHT